MNILRHLVPRFRAPWLQSDKTPDTKGAFGITSKRPFRCHPQAQRTNLGKHGWVWNKENLT